MKVAYVSDAIYPYHKGGKEVRLHEISTRLSAKGHEVHIFTMKWWNGPTEIMQGKVHLHAICRKYPLYTRQGLRSIGEGLMFGLACFKINFGGFDIIDVEHQPYFPLFSTKLGCALRGKKMHATWHEVWGKDYWRKYLGWQGIFGYWVERLAVKMPDKIVAVSARTASQIIRVLKASRNRVCTVPCGVDLDRIASVEPAADRSDIIYTGRLLAHKNLDVLLRAVKIVSKTKPAVRCLIVGDGPEKERLQRMAKRLGIEANVRFFGFLEDQNKVFALMKSSRVFVLPSTREGFGIVVLEANACGLPVVTVDCPDNAARELISEGNGALCSLSPQRLASATLSILHRPAAFSNLQSFEWTAVSHEVEEAYAT